MHILADGLSKQPWHILVGGEQNCLNALVFKTKGSRVVKHLKIRLAR